MKKTNPILIIIIILLLLGAFYLFLKPKTPLVNNNQPPTNQKTQEGTAPKTLRDILSLGTAQKCSWTSTQDNETVSGEMLVSGTKFKQIINITGDDSFTSFAVSDGQWIYTWNTQQPGQGIKMKYPEPSADGSDTPQNNQGPDFSRQYDYQCSPSVISAADLTPPSDIEFMDLSQSVQDLQDKFENLNPSQFDQEQPVPEE